MQAMAKNCAEKMIAPTMEEDEENGFVLNGTKIGISGVPVADLRIVYAFTDRALKHRGISVFLVGISCGRTLSRCQVLPDR